MSQDDDATSTAQIEDRLEQLGRYSRFVRTGLGVILGAFGLTVVVLLPATLDSLPDAVETLLMPLIFVGMGLLLFGIGMHLHPMHLNLVRQLRNTRESESGDVGRDE